MKITLSGMAGSGKSTIGKFVADKLACEFISVGSWSREFAQHEFGMDINEFQDYCSKHPEIDQHIDAQMSKDCNAKSQAVIDYRLGFHFIEDAFHVFLDVSQEIAYRRINKAARSNEKTERSDINKRNKDMQERFRKQYNVDIFDKANYHLVLDTEYLTPDEIVSKVMAALELYLEQLKAKQS